MDEFGHVDEADLRVALPVLARLGLPLLVHAELPAALLDVDRTADPRDYRTWLSSRPPASEQAAIDLLIRLAGEYRVHIHIVHLASAGPLDALRAARRAGLPVSVETCPHYLTFDAEEIPLARPHSSARRRSARPAIAKRCGPRSRGATSISWRPIILRRPPR